MVKEILVWIDGSKYEGEWKDGLRDGYGVWTGTRNEKYSGKWTADKRNGKGKYEDSYYTYEGAWVNDRKEGTGIIFYKNGDSYMGPWKNDQRHGTGVYTKANGLGKYTGEWDDNVKKGKGAMKDPNGTYDGDWVNNMRHGEGAFTSSNGDLDMGKWKEDKRNGIHKIKRGGTLSQPPVELEFNEGLLKTLSHTNDFTAPLKYPPDLPSTILFS